LVPLRSRPTVATRPAFAHGHSFDHAKSIPMRRPKRVAAQMTSVGRACVIWRFPVKVKFRPAFWPTIPSTIPSGRSRAFEQPVPARYGIQDSRRVSVASRGGRQFVPGFNPKARMASMTRESCIAPTPLLARAADETGCRTARPLFLGKNPMTSIVTSSPRIFCEARCQARHREFRQNAPAFRKPYPDADPITRRFFSAPPHAHAPEDSPAASTEDPHPGAASSNRPARDGTVAHRR